jgi:hypothetical protein
MVITMNDAKVRSVAQVRAFLDGAREMDFGHLQGSDDARYGFIARTLRRFDYPRLSKPDKGTIRQYLQHCTGYGRAQITRLITRHCQLGCEGVLSKRYCAPKSAYARRYTDADVALLVEIDLAYNNACGATTVAVLKRQSELHGDLRFANLRHLSASHLYNLRASRAYKAQRQQVAKTRAVQVPIGAQGPPAPWDGRLHPCGHRAPRR